ncbi:hypothetical protein scyTo_0025059 [Scyliorhinus torazame]|uniref:Immunoglobulin domain-containing protein n=1 Tax=Scyliorhinus torazame TaxID=75743 RepID=A0A401QGV4_SCYTO|nr:hypothetical protein [Scyliorhinus torazame]
MAKEHFPLILIFLVLRSYNSESTLSHIPFPMTAEVGQMVELICHCIDEVELVFRYGCKKVLILETRNVQANDSGSYYCARRASYAPLQKAATLLVGDSSTNKTAVLDICATG